MALTYVAGTVFRSGRRRRRVSVRFLVDTGALYTVLPESVWRGLGLKGDRVASARVLSWLPAVARSCKSALNVTPATRVCFETRRND